MNVGAASDDDVALPSTVPAGTVFYNDTGLTVQGGTTGTETEFTYITDIYSSILQGGETKYIHTPTYTERQQINWVTKELGNDKNIVKIETVDPFKYNYDDGTAFTIYTCSDKHTIKSCFADPNSNINIADFVIIYNSLAEAQAARGATELPNNIKDITRWAPCMEKTDGSKGYAARKIVGYSSDTGEMRFHDAFKVSPENGQYYRLFEYSVLDGTYKTVDDAPVNG